MPLSGPPRDWSDARAKVEAEGRCRNCGRSGDEVKLEFDHAFGRRYDEPMPCKTCKGTARRLAGAGPCVRCGGTGLSKTLYVNPLAGVPLCGPEADPNSCHGKKHRREIELLPLMTAEEQAYAVLKLGGIMAALNALTIGNIG